MHPASLRLKIDRLFCSRKELVGQFNVGDAFLREFTGAEAVQNVPIIVGFPDGLTSSLTANYLVEALDLPLVGDIISPELLPVGVVRNFEIGNAIRIYGDHRLVVVVSKFQLGKSLRTLSSWIVELLINFAERHESPMILTVDSLLPSSEDMGGIDFLQQQMLDGEEEDGEGGLGLSLSPNQAVAYLESKEQARANKKTKKAKKIKKNEEDKSANADETKNKEVFDDVQPQIGDVLYISNDMELSDKLNSLGFNPLKEGEFHGITGSLLAESVTRNVAIMCLVSPSRLINDGHASIPIIHAIDKILGDSVIIDTTELSKKVDSIEKMIKLSIAQQLPQLQKAPSEELSMYT